MVRTRVAIRTLLTFLVAAAGSGCGQADRPLAIGAGLNGPFVDAVRLALAETTDPLPPLDTVFVAEATSRAAPALEIADRFRLTPGMVAVVAHSNSASSLATAPVYNEAGIVQIAPTSTAPRYSDAGPYSFRLVPPDDVQGAVLARAIDSLFTPAARVAVLYVNDDYGRGIRAALLQHLDASRSSVVHDQPHADEEFRVAGAARDAHIASMVSSAAASAHDVIVWLGRAQTLQLHLPEIRRTLGAIPILGADALSSWRTFDRRLGYWDGVRHTDFLDPTATPELRAFRERFRARYGHEAGTGDVLSYDGARLILAALADGARSGDAVRDWLNALGRERPAFPGLSGSIAFDENGDVDRPHVLLTIISPAP